MPHMDADYARRLGKLMQRRPSADFSAVSPSGRFRVHYDTEGSERVDPTDSNANGVPDYVDLTMGVLDSVWVLQIDQMGYNPPPEDGGVDGDEYDVYIVDLGRGGAYGFTYPERAGKTSSSYLEIDNDYANPYISRLRTDAARDDCARIPSRDSIWILPRQR